jgi:hypothetical protein
MLFLSYRPYTPLNKPPQDLNRISDQSIFSDLREADVSAGLWVDEDPPLAAISLWISTHR